MKKNKDRPPIVLLLTLLLQIIVPSVGQGISVEQVNGDVTITKDGTLTIMTMDENNHNFTERTPLIRFVNVKEVTFQEFVDNSFRYTLMDESDNKTNKILYSDQSFDYETQPNNYVMRLLVDGQNGDTVPSFVLKLTINNIDDEPPTMSCPQCRFDENTMYTLENTTCSCVVTDSDGWLNKMTFDVLPDGTTGEEGSIFLFEFREKPDDQLKTANVQMYLGKELKYNETSFYLFNIQARDGAGHETIPNNVTMAIVDVNDLRDTPPVWTKFIAFQQFEEQLEKDFQVSARDGDVGLNKDICYSKVREDDEEAKYIHIDERTGTVHVSKIDRDKKDITMYKSEISAFVCEEPDWRTSQVMSFYIIDIDNNSPLVIWVFDYKENNNTYDGETSKSTSLKFYENYAGSLNTTIFIKDIDTGDNAQFSIELENSGGDIDFTKAFMVVPTAGYRSSEFQLNVKNATYLDYEDPSWRHIKFNVLSRGTKNRDRLDRLEVDIQLQDYNDEIPKFELMEYQVKISEATKKEVVITTVLATDADDDDKILKHDLIGSEYALRVLGIKSDTGEIYVKTDDAFDYDTVNPIFVQVRATDAVGHTATVPLTIYLTDVNNKAPTIDVGNPISVEENKEVEFNLDSTIAASDIDTTANLTVKIDWDGSYATKNSRRLNMTDETIAREVKFLNVKFEGKYNGYYKNRTIDIGLEVNNHPKYPAPDYELFDSLYLKLIVTDLNTDEEFLRNEKSSALIVVSIIDINDNTPVFVEPENSNRTVQEKAVIGTSAGSIVAIDLDVNDNVTYECKALSPETDWLEVDTKSGVFIVKDGHINADPDTFTFSYNCTATDTVHISDTLKVDFYIIDGNNRNPELNISDTVNLLERPDDDAIVIDMTKQIRDLDRDVPFHTVVCIFSDSCNDKFYIKNNSIRVRKGEEIDRDTKERNFTCSITCSDNPNGWRGEPSLFSPPFTLIIFVDDINNFIPELDMDDFDCYENLEKNAEIHEIIGKDLDAKENGTIDFNITSVINEETGEDIASIFTILKDDSDYEVNETHKRVHLIASEDLRGYYGTYDITFGLSDEGEPQNSQLQSRKFTIKKYNFESPRFVFPAENEILQLMSVQTLDSPLVVFRERASLQDFEIIADSKDKDCSKWKIKFSITQLEPTGEETVFKLVDKHPCISQLQINDAFNSDRVVEKIFKIQISAWIDAESSPDTNEAPYYTNTNITIRFYNNYQQPTFDQSFRKWTIEFEEGNDSLSEKLKENATYEITDDPNLNIYYYIVPGKNETIERIFEVDRDSGMVSVKEKFYYDFDKQFEFKIVASNDTHPNSTDPDSFLDVCVEVQPANLRTPVWSRDFFFGAIMPGFLSSTIIVSADATDDDVIDQDNLTYSINGTIQRKGNGLDAVSKTDAFIMDQKTGNITLNFRVETTMTGYFSFMICVRDQEDKYHNGPHENCTTTYIFIITNDKTVDFRFYNNVTDVQAREVEMLDIVSDIVGIPAYRHTIENLTTKDNTVYSQASLYFINGTFTKELNPNDRLLREDNPVTASDAESILRIVSNVNTFSKLSSELRDKIQLMLMSFPSTNTTPENKEATLKAWLIGVAIVLGALCFALLITFIFKMKQLNRRISKLTEKKFGSQESGLNRLGISAPTTNKHAIEGSNPVFNTNDMKKTEDMGDFDNQSMRSGDSDLIGIEDNPEFDYSFDRNHDDKIDDRFTYL